MPSATVIHHAFASLADAALARRKGSHPRTTDHAIAAVDLEHAVGMKRALEPLVAEDTERMAAALNRADEAA